MTFEEYMDKNCPNWRQKDLETVQEAMNAFKNWNTWKKISDNTLTNALNHNESGIDYSTDFNKAGEQVGYYSAQLQNAINKLNGNIEIQPIKQNVTK